MYALEAKIRTDDARTVRDNGMIPAVIYGKDVPSTKISLDISSFIKVYREAGQSQIITLTVDGKKYNTLVHEAQRHPVRGNFLHLDFLNINMKEEVEVNIPLTFIGTAPAVLEGNTIAHVLTEITVKCLPADIVESFEVDITPLATVHDTIHIKDLKLGKKFTIINDIEELVVNVHAPKKAEAEETAEVAAE